MSLLRLLNGFVNGPVNTFEKAFGQPTEELPPEEDTVITVDGRRIKKVAPPVADVVDVPVPSVVQPEYVQRAPAGDPAAVDPNNAALLDRRHMIWQAEQAQRAAAAKAAGREYKEQDQSENLKDFKAKPGLQFGTTGLARDIIGNATDFLGGFIGRRPTYRKEKFMDAIYGWDQPGQFEAAMSRGMKYDPEMTREFMKDISGIRTQEAQRNATADYKNMQTLQLKRSNLSSAAFGIAQSDDPAATYANGGKAMLESTLQDLGVETKLPDVYDANLISLLTRTAYKSGDIRAERSTEAQQEGQNQRNQANIESREREGAANRASRETIAEIQARARREAARAPQDPAPVVIGYTVDPFTGSRQNITVPRVVVNKGVSGTKNGKRGYQYNGVFYPAE